MRWHWMLVPAALLALPACEDNGTDPERIVTEVRVVPELARLLINQGIQFEARALDQNGDRIYHVECSWASSNPPVVAIAGDGMARGLLPGSATITVTCDHVEGFAPLEVQDLVGEVLDTGPGHLYGLWGSSATDVFAVGMSGFCWEGCSGLILHYEGTGWSEMRAPLDTEPLTGVWGNSPDDVFAVGERGSLLHYDGASWSRMPSGTGFDLSAVWGTSAADVFAAGVGVLHYDGQSWSPMTIPEGIPFLNGIWGSSGTDVFAVGGAATILHYDGHAWTQMSAPPDSRNPLDLLEVWGTSGDNVFAVGEGGTVLHYDGVAWSPMPVPTEYDLTGVWGASANEVYVVGSRGSFSVILHYDDARWEVVENETPKALFDLWGTAEDVILVGFGPAVVRLKQ